MEVTSHLVKSNVDGMGGEKPGHVDSKRSRPEGVEKASSHRKLLKSFDIKENSQLWQWLEEKQGQKRSFFF